MTQIVCTLFEGSYHHGVVALANSLHSQGFLGDLYAGYRGKLPPWATKATTSNQLGWENATTFSVAAGFNLHFVPLETNWHLTNFKPEFMSMIMERVPNEVEGIYYFDPDIVVTTGWDFFREWLQGGVTGVENDWSPLPVNHPRRLGWRKYFSSYGRELSCQSEIYVNAGLVGVSRNNLDFIHLWAAMNKEMGEGIGGLQNSSIFNRGPSLPFHHCFSAADQDALNAAFETYPRSVSIMGKEFMGFKAGFCGAPHALGSPKPWSQKYRTKYLRNGIRPSNADIGFWENATGPVNSIPISTIKRKLRLLKIIRFLARFYRQAS